MKKMFSGVDKKMQKHITLSRRKNEQKQMIKIKAYCVFTEIAERYGIYPSLLFSRSLPSKSLASSWYVHLDSSVDLRPQKGF